MPQSCSQAETDSHNMWPAAVATLMRLRLRLLLILLPLLLHDIKPNVALTANELVQRSYREQHFETLLLMRHSRQLSCSEMEQLAAASAWPVLRLTVEANFYLKRTQNTEMLAVICLTGNLELDQLQWQALASNLYNMRHVRLLLLLQRATAEPSVPSVQKLLRELAETARVLKFPHVVVLLPTGGAYQLQPYEQPHWQQLQLPASRPIFAKKYNYHGMMARSLPDQELPNAVTHWDQSKGRLQLTGFMAMMILEFAHVHNISLQWQPDLDIKDQLSMMLLRNMTLNQALDLPMTLCGYELSSMAGIYTNPFIISEWAIIVPCAQQIATAKVYLKLVTRNMMIVLLFSYLIFALLDTCFGCLLMHQRWDWTNLLFNERMISGLIGQPCRLHAANRHSSRLTLSQLLLLGLIINTLLAAHLKTLLTMRPMERMVTSFQELRDSQLTIHFSEDDRFYVNQINKINPIHIITPKIIYLNVNDFDRMRKTFSKTKAFAMTTTLWEFYKQQQKLFKRPVLCFHPRLVFRYLLLSSMPLQPNSIYAEPLHHFMLQVKDTGVLMYWMEQTMRDFFSLGKISSQDPNAFQPFRNFMVGDLIYVWLGLSCAWAVAFTTFLCELLVHRLTKGRLKAK